MITDNNISLYNGNGTRSLALHSSSKWFNGCEYVNIKYKDGVLELEKVYLDANKYSVNVRENKEYPNSVKISIKDRITTGVYNFSDESTEDKAIIYINEN